MMIKHTLRLFPLLVSVLFFAGCQTAPEAQFSGDPAIDVSRFESFFVDEFPRDNPALDEGARQILSTIEGYIETILMDKGYTKATTLEEADFVLVPRGRAVPTTTIAGAQFGNYGSGTWLGGTPWGTSSTNEETTTIMVVCYALEAEKIAWIGWARSKSYQNQPDKMKFFEGAATALSDIISQYPARYSGG
jgi:hypothetical protein